MAKKKNNFLRFSGMGVQMGFIIGIFTWLGNFIDKKQQNTTPGWTIGLSLLGVIGSIYIMIKEISKLNDEQ